MEELPPFKDCDAEHVFGEVAKMADSPELRALWQRLHAELKRKGVGAALTYVEGEFDRLRQEFANELVRGQS